MSFLTNRELEKIGFKYIGSNVLVSSKCSIYNPSNIAIGDNSRIDDFSILSAGEGGITIGKCVHIGCYSALIGNAKIFMDDYSGLSSKVSVYASSDDYSGEYMTNPCIPSEFKKTYDSSVHIGRHSVIGSGCVILPGVTIGDCSAVGSMSLVRHNVDDFEVVVGIPAKFLKHRRPDLLKLENEYLTSILETHDKV